jgi:hypothetical protein
MKTTITIFSLLSLFSTTPHLINSAHADSAQESENSSSISSFCRDRLSLLKSAYRKAQVEASAGNVTSSMMTLEKGLRDAALRIDPRYENALTSKSIRRGVALLEQLKATADNKQKIRTINNFLFNYYLFVEDVSNRLDIPYYGSGSIFSRITNTNLQFERLFLNFSKEQVTMVLKTMSTQALSSHGEVIYPVGSTDILLTALKVTTKAMAQDLSESIFASRYACTIESLDQISFELANYLNGHTTYSDEFIAVQELVGATKKTLNGLNGCHGGNYESPTHTADILTHTVRLESGTTKQIRLPNGGQYIKKLIISAEGLRNDAMFEVVVNGDVKGTVYVPGRDPSYFVTIEDSTDSIELVSRGGTALISRILVVGE